MGRPGDETGMISKKKLRKIQGLWNSQLETLNHTPVDLIQFGSFDAFCLPLNSLYAILIAVPQIPLTFCPFLL